jgi:dTDP-4-dehydrorhamnose reductase
MPSRVAILVLGSSGMLGSTVLHRLRGLHPDWRVDGSERSGVGLTLEAEAGRSGVAQLFRIARYDFVVNCIGVLKNAIDAASSESIERAIRVNALFPHEVASVADEHHARVIHVSTDAVFSGRAQQPYTESSAPDPVNTYGATKVLGESPAANVLNVRCSIVGRDRRQRGLLEWYLASPTPTVVGFVDYVWTPVTTIQFADWCARTIQQDFDAIRAAGHVLHLAPNAPMSKAAFLESLRDCVGAGPTVERRPDPGGPCFRVLGSRRCPPGPHDAAPRWSDLIPELMSEFSRRGV